MKWIKAGAAVLNQTPLHWDGNLARIVGAIQQARAQQVSLLCMPELCISGYGCEDAFHSPGLQRTVGEILLEIVPQTQGMMVSVGLPMMVGGGLFNTACMMADGQILGFVAKQNLAGEGIHYEQRWFKAWPEGARTEVELEGRVPEEGDLVDVIQSGAGLRQAPVNGSRGPGPVVLGAREAFLQSSCDNLSIPQQAG